MTASAETRWYWPPEPADRDEPGACVYESEFNGERCGRDLPTGAAPDDLFCTRHTKAVGIGAIGWEEVLAYRAHHQV
ncbi:hypothetical protein ACFVWN_01265 [Nocardiopsis flavescens]|uniref:hypothetical protein n=1 Tax=Nocardiopsis flavescens TaxID=758803 RepID=UPI003656F5D8